MDQQKALFHMVIQGPRLMGTVTCSARFSRASCVNFQPAGRKERDGMEDHTEDLKDLGTYKLKLLIISFSSCTMMPQR